MSIPVIILAGGLGTRLENETLAKPKPMVSIGGYPIILHIMFRYALHGHNEFIILGGYKVEVIKDFFSDFHNNISNLKIKISKSRSEIEILEYKDKWVREHLTNFTVTILDTGLDSTTAGRISQAKPLVNGRQFFCTYGDGLCDVDIDLLLRTHKRLGTQATVTAVNPPSRFGDLSFGKNQIAQDFHEKQLSSSYINGGYFVFEPSIFEELNINKSLEEGLLTDLTSRRQLGVHIHSGFWQNMDTPREMRILNDLYMKKSAYWLEYKHR